MKKVLILIAAIAATACSKDDNDNNNNTNNGGGVNPPSPIQYAALSVATPTVTFTTLSSTQTVAITAGSGSYTATTAEPIVALTIVSNTLQLTSVATGTTTVTVLDVLSQQKAEIGVSIKLSYTVDEQGTITQSDRKNFSDDTDLVISDVKAIADGVFSGFGEFRSITTHGVETIGKKAFASCQSVEEITLNKVKTIGLGAFQFNASVKTITITGIENEELSIAKEAFASCHDLKTILLPAQTKEIGVNAFLQCRQIAVVKCAAPEPPKISRNTFPSLLTEVERILYVPKGSKEKYENSPNWKSKFTSIEELN